jgi:3'(2'), 5'-bisphosphate nucleotidase
MIETARIAATSLIPLMRQAGDAVMTVYADEFTVSEKEDRSPLTEADRRANEILVNGLRDMHPDIPFISEEAEAMPYEERSGWEYFWLIDPLDGTKEFINRNGEFTINVALVADSRPVLGLVFQPVGNRLFYGDEAVGAWQVEEDCEPSRMVTGPHYSTLETVRVVASRSHRGPEVDAFVARLETAGKRVETTSCGSSLKICSVAAGSADVYPRFGPTMEWDTAAAHAVAGLAGRNVLDAETRTPLAYNKADLHNPWFIVE